MRLLFTRGRVILLIGLVVNVCILIGYLALDRYYSNTTVVPNVGGEYVEGVVGAPVSLNPLTAISDVDRDICSLVFSGLTKIGANNQIVGDLALHWDISADNLTYTFALRHDVKWHDGQPFTAQDVVFTIKTIQDPNYPGPLNIRGNWLGVDVQAPDDYTVQFKLSGPYAAFLENTSIGIVPQHLLSKVNIADLLKNDFNKNPIGTGAYRLGQVKSLGDQAVSAALPYFSDFYGKPPYIRTLTLRFYSNFDDMLSDFRSHKVLGMQQVPSSSFKQVEDLHNAQILHATLPQYQAVFFNTKSDKTYLQDVKVRQALSLAIDRKQLIKDVLGGRGDAVDGPLVSSSWAYTPPKDAITYDVAKARQILADDGWKDTDGDGILEKNNVKLAVTILTDDQADRYQTAKDVTTMWTAIGVQANTKSFLLGVFIDTYLRKRDYDAVLFGQNLSWDPDIYAYWHSSQINDPGLNISLLNDTKVDKLLEDARKLTDQQKRQDKYAELQQAIRDDAPAAFLYSPWYTYVVSSAIHNVTLPIMINSQDRFGDLSAWYMDTKRVKLTTKAAAKPVTVNHDEDL